jgi:hypothetical protein
MQVMLAGMRALSWRCSHTFQDLFVASKKANLPWKISELPPHLGTASRQGKE